MKTTCICCGKRATHEVVRSLGGTWYRCNACNYAWRGVRRYLYSVIANIWWPIRGPSHPSVVQQPLSGPPTPTRPVRPAGSDRTSGRGGGTVGPKLEM